jgi:hypothetical protein
MTFTDFNNQRGVLNRRIGTRQEVSGGGGGGGGPTSWGSITGTLSSQSDLQSALNGKASTTHSHAMSDVTGLAAALAAKQDAGSYASSSHGHIIANISGLQAELDDKAPLDSPTFTGTVTLPAGQVVNGVTLTDAGSATNFLREDGVYGPVSGGGTNDIDGGGAASVYGGAEIIDGGDANG